MSKKQTPVVGRWGRRKREFAVCLWVAFLSASVGSVVLFGLIDPAEVQTAWMEQYDISRKLGYGLGFGFLFLVSFLSSWLTAHMISSGPRRGHAKGKGARRPPEIKDPAKNNPDLDLEDIK